MGWSSQLVIARQVIIYGPQDGLFVYDGTPGAGNPPIAWATDNTTDLYGNTVYPQIGVRDPATGRGVILRSSQAIFLNTHAYNETASSDAYLYGLPATATDQQSSLFMLSPTDDRLQAMMQLLGQSGDDSLTPLIKFLLWDNHASAVSTGLQIAAAELTAFTPGSSASQLEGWHPMTLLNSWLTGSRAAPQYRFLAAPPNSVELLASFTAPAGIAAGQAIWDLPAGYTVNSPQSPIGRNQSTNAAVIFSVTTGSPQQLQYQAGAASGNVIDLHWTLSTDG